MERWSRKKFEISKAEIRWSRHLARIYDEEDGSTKRNSRRRTCCCVELTTLPDVTGTFGWQVWSSSNVKNFAKMFSTSTGSTDGNVQAVWVHCEQNRFAGGQLLFDELLFIRSARGKTFIMSCDFKRIFHLESQKPTPTKKDNYLSLEQNLSMIWR